VLIPCTGKEYVKEEQEATEVLNEVLAMKLQLTSYLEMVKAERVPPVLPFPTKTQPTRFPWSDIPQSGSSQNSSFRTTRPQGGILTPQSIDMIGYGYKEHGASSK